jgi:hypothetical protein
VQERVYLLFVMTLGDSFDIIATLFTVPTIVICRASQRRLATERLGYPLSVYDDLRTRGCSYNLPSQKAGGTTSPAPAPCRTAAAAAAAVAAAALECTDTRPPNNGGTTPPGGCARETGAAAAAATVAASVAANASAASGLASSDLAALMNGASQPVATDAGKQINAPLALGQPGLANMNGLGAIFDLAPRPSEGGGQAGQARGERGPNAGAARRISKDGSGSMDDDDDELTQDEEDARKEGERAGDGGTTANNVCGSARSRGTKRALDDAPHGNAAVATSAAGGAPGTSAAPPEAQKAGATNLAWLRVGQQLQNSHPESSQAGVQEAHNLVSKLPRLTGQLELANAARTAVASGAPASVSAAGKIEDQMVKGNLHVPASSQPLHALLALCNSQSNKPHLPQLGTASPGSAAPAITDQKVSAAGGNSAAAAIASALRNAQAVATSAPKKATALDIQTLYQWQTKQGSSTAPVSPALGLPRPSNGEANNTSVFAHRRPSGGAHLGAPSQCMIS